MAALSIIHPRSCQSLRRSSKSHGFLRLWEQREQENMKRHDKREKRTYGRQPEQNHLPRKNPSGYFSLNIYVPFKKQEPTGNKNPASAKLRDVRIVFFCFFFSCSKPSIARTRGRWLKDEYLYWCPENGDRSILASLICPC